MDGNFTTAVLLLAVIWLSCLIVYQQTMITVRRELDRRCSNQLPEEAVAVCLWLYWQYVQWQQTNRQPDDVLVVDLDGDDDASDGWSF